MFTGSREKGASAVEFALVLPVLMLILFGIIEFGFIIYDKAVITNASREGARAGIVIRTDLATGAPAAVPFTEIETTATDYCSSYLVSLGSSVSSAPTVTAAGDCSSPGNSLTVAVSYPYTFLVLPNFTNSFFSKSLAPSITLNGVTVMRCENQ